MVNAPFIIFILVQLCLAGFSFNLLEIFFQRKPDLLVFFVQVTDQPTEPDVIELGICPTVPAKHAVFVGDPWQSTRSDFWSVPSVK